MSISAADPRNSAVDTLPHASPAINVAELNALDDPYPRHDEMRQSPPILKGGPAGISTFLSSHGRSDRGLPVG